ncbi:hypothetical protein ACE10Z_34455 [Bradyrhizobium sp. Pha-3]|uniref:hypothetical protein n=1 Tax=Bradyrhizobium sp. Pha-3 TaxID=208375 RepID=UPI0035D503F3
MKKLDSRDDQAHPSNRTTMLPFAIVTRAEIIDKIRQGLELYGSVGPIAGLARCCWSARGSDKEFDLAGLVFRDVLQRSVRRAWRSAALNVRKLALSQRQGQNLSYALCAQG